jgi:hypothetical protein
MERERPQRERPQATGGDGEPAGGNLDSIRSDMERLLAAGDELVKKALSGDSAAFLEASRQRGGQ